MKSKPVQGLARKNAKPAKRSSATQGRQPLDRERARALGPIGERERPPRAAHGSDPGARCGDAVQPRQGERARRRCAPARSRRRPSSPATPDATGSTITETQGVAEARQRESPPLGTNRSDGSLDRVRVDSGDRPLTTNQGVEIADNQNSLKAGARGPALLEDFILREKITHFDHERIPERIVHARGSGAHGYFECYEPLTKLHARLDLRRGRQAHARVRAFLDGGGRARLRRYRARRARLRREVLHRRGQLGPGRQQHPRLLHPGRDEVSRPDPRREARAAPRDAAGGHRARHVLGLRVADARVDAHADVGDVRPRDPAQLSHDAGLRRAHVPARERARRVALREVPLEPARGHPLARLGRGREDLGRRPGLPPPRPLGGDRVGRLSRVRARPAGLHARSRRTRSASTCSTPPRSCPRSSCRCSPSGGSC